MARSYRRDARGRFAGAGYSGQTGGRGARLMASGTRAGGGAKITAGRVGGTINKVPGKRASPKPSPQPAAKPAMPGLRKRKGGMSDYDRNALDAAKTDLAIYRERLAGARKMKQIAKGPLEKLNATSRINEHQLNITRATQRATKAKAAPMFGRPVHGADRWGNTMRNTSAARPNTVRRKIRRDAGAAAKLKGPPLNTTPGRYRRLYAFNANKAAQAASRRAVGHRR